MPLIINHYQLLRYIIYYEIFSNLIIDCNNKVIIKLPLEIIFFYIVIIF